MQQHLSWCCRSTLPSIHLTSHLIPLTPPQNLATVSGGYQTQSESLPPHPSSHRHPVSLCQRGQEKLTCPHVDRSAVPQADCSPWHFHPLNLWVCTCSWSATSVGPPHVGHACTQPTAITSNMNKKGNHAHFTPVPFARLPSHHPASASHCSRSAPFPPPDTIV